MKASCTNPLCSIPTATRHTQQIAWAVRFSLPASACQSVPSVLSCLLGHSSKRNFRSHSHQGVIASSYVQGHTFRSLFQ
eukprot:4520531-Amphidinium_carterae.1